MLCNSIIGQLYLCMILFQVEVIKMDLRKEVDDKEKQIKMLQQTLQGMQQQLIDAKRIEKDLQMKRKSAEKEPITLEDSETESTETATANEAPPVVEAPAPSQQQQTAAVQALNDRDAKLVSII